jgi:hypothetical protein
MPPKPQEKEAPKKEEEIKLPPAVEKVYKDEK